MQNTVFLIAKSGKEIKFLSPCYARRKRKKLGTHKQLQEGKRCCKATKHILATPLFCTAPLTVCFCFYCLPENRRRRSDLQQRIRLDLEHRVPGAGAKAGATMHLYNLTLQRATGITHSVHGNFSGSKLQEIIVSRGKTLELLRPDTNTGKVQSNYRHIFLEHTRPFKIL